MEEFGVCQCSGVCRLRVEWRGPCAESGGADEARWRTSLTLSNSAWGSPQHPPAAHQHTAARKMREV